MGIRLFVGNLSFSLGDGDLREAFAEIGGVERARNRTRPFRRALARIRIC
ncbi:hypothetical protein [Candidatus Binatus sp.]